MTAAASTEAATTMTTASIVLITAPTGVSATKYGDVNLDEEINVSDVVAINLYILNQKKYPLEDKAIANADCVKDNVINTSDSTMLMNYTAEIIDVSELGK